MWLDQDQTQKDLEKIAATKFIPWEKLQGKTIFVTGGTGLIGYATVTGLLYASREKRLGLRVLALVRNLSQARKRFAAWLQNDDLEFIVGTVEDGSLIREKIDYIIHGASQTASKAFVNQGVETINTAVLGTNNMLKLAKEKKCAGFIYLSSMEVYGRPQKGHKVKETDIGAFDPLNLRNSYPISKQLCETLCCAYAQEYGVPATIVRLTQTFGAGVAYNDSRVFAEFGRCVVEKRDIVLKTKGETERSYLYIADAVTAILTILLKGSPGRAYNAADESTYCSIAQMAQKVAQMGGVNVRYELQDETELGFLKTLYMDLDTERLCALGWQKMGEYSLSEMFRLMIHAWH